MYDAEEDLQTIDVTRPHGSRTTQWPPTQPEEPRGSDGRPRRAGPAVAALVVMMLIAGVAGFAVTKQVRTGKDFTRAVTSPAAPTDRDEAALGDLNLQQSDVSARYRVDLIQNGGSVAGATLDLCNGTFPSEALRTARRQVAAVDTIGSLTLSTEAVLYRRPADTAQAFRELAHAQAHVPEQGGSGREHGDHQVRCRARQVMVPVRERRAPRLRRQYHRSERGARPFDRGIPAARTCAHGRVLRKCGGDAADGRR